MIAAERGWTVATVVNDHPMAAKKDKDRRPDELALIEMIRSGRRIDVVLLCSWRIGVDRLRTTSPEVGASISGRPQASLEPGSLRKDRRCHHSRPARWRGVVIRHVNKSSKENSHASERIRRPEDLRIACRRCGTRPETVGAHLARPSTRRRHPGCPVFREAETDG